MPRRTAAERSLERTLLVNLALHALAMLSMAALLLPALPGGTHADPMDRALYVYTWRFVITAAWIPWQLCALADLWLAVTMLRTPWLPKGPSWWALVFTVAAIVPDQWGEFQWSTTLPELAREALRRRDAHAFAAHEAEAFRATAGFGATLYTVAALGWTVAFARAGTWARWLTALSVPMWSVLGVVALSALAPDVLALPAAVVSAGNALGFAALEVWLFGVTEAVLRRARPFTATAREALWRYPERGLVGAALAWIANSRVISAFIEPMPVPAMVSDIEDVLYVNYLVDAERLLPLVPEGLELQRLGPDGRYALFTWLTFRHGHFGFAFMGPLRRLMPSPVQTNWRIHVRDPRTGVVGIHFVTNAIDRAPPALAARLTTEGMPMHVLREARLVRGADGAVDLTLDPGEGTAPDATCHLTPTQEHPWEGAWRDCWGDWRAFLDYCLPQERAMSTQPWRDRVTRHEIELGLDPARCVPLAGDVRSRRAASYVGDAKALCFRVPAVRFRFAVEATDPLP